MLKRPPAGFRYLVTAVVFLAAFSLAAPLTAEERHGHAHRHGVSTLKLAIDGTELEMEIISPGSDIVGFEHPPANAADRQAIANATAVFREAGALFAFPATAGCRVLSAEVEAPSASGSAAEKHDHEKHHDGKDGKEGEHHAEFHGHYRFRCGNPEKLTHIDIKLFDGFPRAREIEVEAITPSGQIARELTRTSARLKF